MSHPGCLTSETNRPYIYAATMVENMALETQVPQFADTEENFAIFSANFRSKVPEVIRELQSERVFLLVSSSLSSATGTVQSLEMILGPLVVGKKVGVKPHTSYTDVLDMVGQLHITRADTIVSIGGSSYTDAAKIAMIVHSSLKPSDLNVAAMSTLVTKTDDTSDIISPPGLKDPVLKLIVVPTTLSGAEYNMWSGAIHPETHQKVGFAHPKCAPKYIILDPELCMTTPRRLWLGTGMGAVDHCVEAMCTDLNREHEEKVREGLRCFPKSPHASLDDTDRRAVDRCMHALSISISKPPIEKEAEGGLRHLVPGMLACRVGNPDVDAILKCHVGAWKAMQAVHYKLPLGASHAIGRHMGRVAGVLHWETSSVMLPSVMKYNKAVNSARQEMVAEILWSVAGETFREQGLTRDAADAGDLLKTLAKTLGLPTTLGEVGVREEAQLVRIAEHTLTDVWAKTNSRRVENREQVREILRMAS